MFSIGGGRGKPPTSALFDYSPPLESMEKGDVFFVFRFSLFLATIEEKKGFVFTINQRFEDFSREYNLLTNFGFLHFCLRRNSSSIFDFLKKRKKTRNEILQIFSRPLHILLHFNFAKFPAEIVNLYFYPRYLI